MAYSWNSDIQCWQRGSSGDPDLLLEDFLGGPKKGLKRVETTN